MPNMNRYKLEATLLLPFRGWLPSAGFLFTVRFGKDDWETSISLGCTKHIAVLGPPHIVDASSLASPS